MDHKDYWLECVQCAFDECGIIATDEQAHLVAEHVEGAHENMGMAFHVPESPYPSEIKKLETALAKERSKVVCPECRGRGRIILQGPYHSSNSQCDTCRGEGKVLP